MNCAELEIVLADYIDGTLAPAERARVEAHLSSCPGCSELLNDVRDGLALIERAPDVLPPPELITRIAFRAPMGRTREPFERQGFLSRIATRWLQPILQPRLAMGMAMTILSFAMLERCTGVRVQHIQAADLNPVRIWGGMEDKAVRAKDRAVKYYENLRWVYEIETSLRSLQSQQDASEAQAQKASGQAAHEENSAGQSGREEGNK